MFGFLGAELLAGSFSFARNVDPCGEALVDQPQRDCPLGLGGFITLKVAPKRQGLPFLPHPPASPPTRILHFKRSANRHPLARMCDTTERWVLKMGNQRMLATAAHPFSRGRQARLKSNRQGTRCPIQRSQQDVAFCLTLLSFQSQTRKEVGFAPSDL